jgi:FMN phosphatase YigB (HAD superfamily)
MAGITHIFFDLPGVLVDTVKLNGCYGAQIGVIMAQRYGGEAEKWTEAQRRITADWDSYYADLDLDGEDGIEHLWEGMYRTTRALFRLTNMPEPPQHELTTFSRELPGLAAQSCDALFPEAREVMQRVYEAGYTLGIISHFVVSRARGTLIGGGSADFFKGALVGPDVVGHFVKDAAYYTFAARQAKVSPECSLVVESQIQAMRSAKNAGMQTVYVRREQSAKPSAADCTIEGDLWGLVRFLEIS